MVEKKPIKSPKPLWAYSYQIVPPQAEDRLRTIKTMLDQEGVAAQRGARVWAGRVVVEPQVTHILVVSDSPQQNHGVNLRLEARLTELKAGFSISAPMAVLDDAEQAPTVE